MRKKTISDKSSRHYLNNILKIKISDCFFSLSFFYNLHFIYRFVKFIFLNSLLNIFTFCLTESLKHVTSKLLTISYVSLIIPRIIQVRAYC